MDNKAQNQLQVQSAAILQKGIEYVDLFVNKNYLIDMSKADIIPLAGQQKHTECIKLFQVTKIVYDPGENTHDKLVSVYSALCNFGSEVIMIVDGKPSGISLYIGTRDIQNAQTAGKILSKTLKGNFPGVVLTEMNQEKTAQLLESAFPEKYASKAISSVSVIPSRRDVDKTRFVQGIEKFIDTMAAETYTAVFIASPLNKAQLEQRKRGLEHLYTSLSAHRQINISYGENESEAVAKGISDSFANAVSEGISDTVGAANGTNAQVSRGTSHGNSFSILGFGFNSSRNRSSSQGQFSSTIQSSAQTRGKTETRTNGTSQTDTSTRGSNLTLNLHQENKTVSMLMQKIETQLIRIDACESFGLWKCAGYFVGNDMQTALVAANTYKALVAGEDSCVENSFVNSWDDNCNHWDRTGPVMEYLHYGMHPQFRYEQRSGGKAYSGQIISPASIISGQELPLIVAMPMKSVSGVSSITMASFGRNISINRRHHRRLIYAGCVHHMGETLPHNRVPLSLDALTGHCFVTGSTGSGKSNTVYHLLEEVICQDPDVKFLVIEPAKGEYKYAFGGLEDVHIFTTNPGLCSMLQINPFEFPEGVHVLEHLSRLSEVMNACWPLYAAMPALLKEAFEKAYAAHGWDLVHSRYVDVGLPRFPSFKTVLDILPKIIRAGGFSGDTRGDYEGALVTRVHSLTNGILGQVFCSHFPIPDQTLFEENTIIDLSRIGSPETVALIMGMLILKITEAHISRGALPNQPLRHVTVLEEAHNILRRTSTAQSQETVNVQGKAVEMLRNCIAEMRTYGESFFIVDQSPSAVDTSAIINTNTKIIMNLSEQTDIIAAGSSISLRDGQIQELSRLGRGVAVVYQDAWEDSEPVLVKIDKAKGEFAIRVLPRWDDDKYRQMLGDTVSEILNECDEETYDANWASRCATRVKVPDYRKSELKQKITTAYEGIKKKSRRDQYKTVCALITELLGCRSAFDICPVKGFESIRHKDDLTAGHLQIAADWMESFIRVIASYYTLNPANPGLQRRIAKAVLVDGAGWSADSRTLKAVIHCLDHTVN